ncbi:unnamed protein product [Phaeothamnion confervicola]
MDRRLSGGPFSGSGSGSGIGGVPSRSGGGGGSGAGIPPAFRGPPTAPHVRPAALQLTTDERRLFKLLLRVVEEERLGTTLRVAGGWVRDKLLGRPEQAGQTVGYSHKVDIDIALDNCLGREFAEKINNFLLRIGRKSHAVGVVSKNPDKSKHLETATMQLGGFWIDFVNLRTESYTLDSRIPNMGIGTAEEDAYRRDLTINSLFYNINTACVEDFTGRGASDLAAGVVSTPLPASTTLLDDPLRVLRSVRFASRFCFRMSDDLLRACMTPEVHEALGKKVSRERIGAEVDLMVRSQEPLLAFELICELGLASVIFPMPDTLITPLPLLPAAAASISGTAAVAELGAAASIAGAEIAAAAAVSSSGSAAAGSGARHADAAAAEVFRHSLVYLKNMHHLLRDGAVAATAGLSEDPTERGEERRLALYSAFLLPFADSYCRDAKGAVLPLPRHLMADMLKTRARDACTVHVLHRCALDFQLLLRRSTCAPLTAGNSARFAVDRLSAGLIMRQAGPLWTVALLLALTGDLGTQHILDDAVRGRRDKEEDAAIADAYLHMARCVREMGLQGVWDRRPPLDGNELQALLPRLPRGPAFKAVVDEQVRWMLCHPDGTRDDAVAHVRNAFAEYTDAACNASGGVAGGGGGGGDTSAAAAVAREEGRTAAV